MHLREIFKQIARFIVVVIPYYYIWMKKCNFFYMYHSLVVMYTTFLIRHILQFLDEYVFRLVVKYTYHT